MESKLAAPDTLRRARGAAPAASRPGSLPGIGGDADPRAGTGTWERGAVASLEGDARVRERLRFLLWMRGVHLRDRRPAPARAPAGAR